MLNLRSRSLGTQKNLFSNCLQRISETLSTPVSHASIRQFGGSQAATAAQPIDSLPGSFDISNDITNIATRDGCPTTRYNSLFNRISNEVKNGDIDDLETNGTFYKCSFFGQATLLALNPQSYKTVVNLEVRGKSTFMGRPTMTPLFTNKTLFTKQGKEHFRYRQEFRKFLDSKIISNPIYIKLITNEIDNALNEIVNENKFVDFIDKTRQISWNVGIKYLFGRELIEKDELLKGSYLMELVSCLGKATMDFNMINKPGSAWWIGMKAKEELYQILPNLISTARDMYNNGKLEKNTALYTMFHDTSLMIEKENEWDVVAFIYGLLFAALDTTSHSMTSLLYCTAEYDEEYQLLKEYLFNDDIGKKLIDPNYEISDINEIDTSSPLHWFVQESTRLFPAAFANARQITKDCVVEGTCVKAGTIVLTPGVYFSRNNRYFGNDSGSFKFQRFEHGHPNVDAMMPFGKGPRQCLGMHLAYLELKTLLLMMIRKNLKIEIEGGTQNVKFFANPLLKAQYKARLVKENM